MTPEISNLCEIVTVAAQEEIQGRFRIVSREFKADGSIVTAADHAMQQRLTHDLKRYWPNIPLLGEEMDLTTQTELLRNHDTGVWVLDPVDGTTNFAAGIPIFAVSIALIRNGTPILGIIYDSIHEECFAAVAGVGAWLNGIPLKQQTAPPLADCVASIDLKRLSPELVKYLVNQPPYGSQRNFGSSVLEWAWVAAGRIHLYLHGCQALWDYAAGVLILTEAGGRATTLEGETVFRPDLTRRSVIAALDHTAFIEWQKYLNNFSHH